MVEGQFNIIFAGKVIPSKSVEEVKAALVKLFKSSPEQIDKLFAQSTVVIKRNLDYAQALKYQSALKQAGALVLLQKAETEEVPTQVDDAQAGTAQVENKTSAVKKPNPFLQEDPQAREVAGEKTKQEQSDNVSTETTEINEANPNDASWSLANAGEVLPAIEKVAAIEMPDLSELSLDDAGGLLVEPADKVIARVDTSGLEVSEVGMLQEIKPKEKREVDVSSLSIAEAGEKIPNEKIEKKSLNPNTEHLKLT